MKHLRLALVIALGLLLTAVLPRPAAAATAWALTTAPAAEVRQDTGGRDDLEGRRAPQSERELRRELRRLNREIRRAEQIERQRARKGNAPVGDTAPGTARGSERKRGMAVASLVIGIAMFPLALVGGAIVFVPAATCAIVFGSIGRKRAKRYPDLYRGRGMATAGMILGLVGGGLIAVGLLLALFFALIFGGF